MKKRGDTVDGWEIGAEEVILETRVGNIISGPVTCLRSGLKKKFYLFDFPDWVNVVAVTREMNLVLVRQYRYGRSQMELEIPGGMINPGEDPVVAGCRELLEETGFTGKNSRLIGKVCPNPAIQRNTCFTVLVEEAEKSSDPHFDDMEDIEYLELSRKEVWKLVQKGDIDHGLVLNALMHYEKLLDETLG